MVVARDWGLREMGSKGANKMSKFRGSDVQYSDYS